MMGDGGIQNVRLSNLVNWTGTFFRAYKPEKYPEKKLQWSVSVGIYDVTVVVVVVVVREPQKYM